MHWFSTKAPDPTGSIRERTPTLTASWSADLSLSLRLAHLLAQMEASTITTQWEKSEKDKDPVSSPHPPHGPSSGSLFWSCFWGASSPLFCHHHDLHVGVIPWTGGGPFEVSLTFPPPEISRVLSLCWTCRVPLVGLVGRFSSGRYPEENLREVPWGEPTLVYHPPTVSAAIPVSTDVWFKPTRSTVARSSVVQVNHGNEGAIVKCVLLARNIRSDANSRFSHI